MDWCMLNTTTKINYCIFLKCFFFHNIQNVYTNSHIGDLHHVRVNTFTQKVSEFTIISG